MTIEMSDANDEVVLLIHGTFAQPEPGKLKWWQVGSNPWKEIEKRLPQGTTLDDGKHGAVFSWTGNNQERDRYWSGLELLNRLLKLERQGRPYHLVGHSHGGSVIWHALQEAMRHQIGRKRLDPLYQLPNLRSWATVGTPFLQFNESGMGRWPGAILTKFFFFVSWMITIFLGFAVYGYLQGHASSWNLEGLFGVLLPAIIVIGAIVIAAIPGFALHMWISAIRREALSVRQTAFVRSHAMREFGDRWLGLWSREDEAIGGLKGSIRLQIQLLPKLEFRSSRVFLYDRRIWSYRILLRWLVAPLLNRFIPYGNNMILSTMSKTAQGDDRPGCVVTSVSEGPICFGDKYRYPTLPEQVDDELVAVANKRLIAKAPDFVPKVRTLLADYSSGVALLGGGVKAGGFEFVGDELVHTSYFDHPNVLDLVAHHIDVHRHGQSNAARHADALGQWYRSVREDVKTNVTESRVVQQRNLNYLQRPNRLATLSVVLGLTPLVGLPASVTSGDLGATCFTITCVLALLGLVFGRMGQLRAERGARKRRVAAIGVNLGLLWLSAAAAGPVMYGVFAVVGLFGSTDDHAITPTELNAIRHAIQDEDPVVVCDGGEDHVFVSDKSIVCCSRNATKQRINLDEITSFQLVIQEATWFTRASSTIIVETNDGTQMLSPIAGKGNLNLRFFEAIRSGVKSVGGEAKGSIIVN